MASDRIEELKTASSRTERRGGYDRRAVDAYLAELADWLETGGEDEARRAVIQRAMERWASAPARSSRPPRRAPTG